MDLTNLKNIFYVFFKFVWKSTFKRYFGKKSCNNKKTSSNLLSKFISDSNHKIENI